MTPRFAAIVRRPLPPLAAAALCGCVLCGCLAAGCTSEPAGVSYDAVRGGEDEAVAVAPPAELSPEDSGERSPLADPAVTPAAAVLDAPAAPVEPATEPDGVEEEEFAGGFRPAEAPAAAAAPAEPAVENAAAGEPRELELLVPDRSFLPAGGGRGVRVSFDDLDLLKVLNAEPVPGDVVERFPDWLSGLDGRTVRLRGFMYPTYADPVTRFILARDNQICCFGRNPKPYDLVSVKLAEGNSSPYIQNRPFDVVGTFRIDPVRDGDDWLQLYKITDAEVIE